MNASRKIGDRNLSSRRSAIPAARRAEVQSLAVVPSTCDQSSRRERKLTSQRDPANRE
jgi:hypothetical protein